ncbi:MAG: pyridoxal phosphate-dependent aminotransferase [Alphaproteobacteria bacterium]|tara:strand:- start:77 stop:1243 length:1167 start_codon:yes stop_codon:yes gene_type:complete
MNNNFFFPSNRSKVDAFAVMQMLSKANDIEKTGKIIYHLELGEPQVSTPIEVKNKIKELLNHNLPGYTPSNGIVDLRLKISEYYKLKYKLNINPDNIFITTGSSGAFLLSFLSCFDAKKKVGIFNPAYPAYRNILRSLDLDVIEIEPNKDNICKIDIKKVESYKFLDGLIISNPNNPNGQIFSDKELEYIYKFCESNNITLISDEIYHGIEYDKQYSKSVLNFGSDSIIINSFSKYFCMPGWRLGWTIIPDYLKENFLKLSQNIFISSGSISQYSAIKVFDCLDSLDKIVSKYSVNKNVVSQNLSKFKRLKFFKPSGAFYYYLDVSDFHDDSSKLVSRILRETGVVLTPGTDFDKINGHKTMRLAFSCKKNIVEKATEKLTNWFLKNY